MLGKNATRSSTEKKETDVPSDESGTVAQEKGFFLISGSVEFLVLDGGKDYLFGS